MARLAANPLVLDTSVWINILATEESQEIMRILSPNHLAPIQVIGEIKRNPVTQQSYSETNHPLLNSPNVKVVELTGEELDLFLDLVGATSSDRIGDGEAAAIALAVHRQALLGLDDKKARRIARSRFGDLNLAFSAELLTSAQVVSGLGQERSSTAFEKAKKFGRMHVPP